LSDLDKLISGVTLVATSVGTLSKSQQIMHKDIADLTKSISLDLKERKQSKSDKARSYGLQPYAQGSELERQALQRDDPRTKEAFEMLKKIQETGGSSIDRIEGVISVWERVSAAQEKQVKRDAIASAILTGKTTSLVNDIANMSKHMGVNEAKAAANTVRINRQIDEQISFSQAKIGLADAVTNKFGILGKFLNPMKDKAAAEVALGTENKSVVNAELKREEKRGKANDRVNSGKATLAEKRVAQYSNERAESLGAKPIQTGTRSPARPKNPPRSKGETTSVGDAIITKTGKVINTHPEDNLMAFKTVQTGGDITKGGTPAAAKSLLGGKGGALGDSDKYWKKKATNPTPGPKDVLGKTPEFIAIPFLYLGSLLTGKKGGKKGGAGEDEEEDGDLLGGIFSFIGDMFGLGGGGKGKKKKGKGRGKAPRAKGKGGKGGGGIGGAIGDAIGSFIGSLLEGIAGGLKAFANPMAIAGAAVFAGLAVALGFALNLLAPALKELAPVLIKVADVIGNVFIKAIEKAPEIIRAIGDAIGGIFKSIGDTVIGIIKTVVSSVKQLEQLDGGRLLLAAAGIGAIGVSLGVFAIGSAGAGIVQGVSAFFGVDPVKQFKQFADIATPLSIAAFAIVNLTDALQVLEKIDMMKVGTNITKFGDALRSGSLTQILTTISKASPQALPQGPNARISGAVDEKTGLPVDEMLATVKEIRDIVKKGGTGGGGSSAPSADVLKYIGQGPKK